MPTAIASASDADETVAVSNPAPAASSTPSRLDRLTLWAAHNRGIQTRIAAELRPAVTAQFVHHVLMGKRRSRGGVVEKLLRKAGAPI
jgi:hypothetical protein